MLMGLLIMTLYLGIGDDFNPGNYINMGAVLFMWITMPAFGAAAYVPSLVLGEYTAIETQQANVISICMLSAVAEPCTTPGHDFYQVC